MIVQTSHLADDELRLLCTGKRALTLGPRETYVQCDDLERDAGHAPTCFRCAVEWARMTRDPWSRYFERPADR